MTIHKPADKNTTADNLQVPAALQAWLDSRAPLCKFSAISVCSLTFGLVASSPTVGGPDSRCSSRVLRRVLHSVGFNPMTLKSQVQHATQVHKDPLYQEGDLAIPHR